MKKIILLLLFTSTIAFSQAESFKTEEIAINSLIKGTLFNPSTISSQTKLVILIAGSGPTNRSGNQIGLVNNSLKFLSENLAQKGIAVFSYDKRIIAQMISGKIDEKSLSFDDFINDAKEVVSYFKNQKKYQKIIIAGHSEGSLIGMVSSQTNVDAFVSLAGAGNTIDVIIGQQVVKQLPTLKAEVDKNFAILKTGKTFHNENSLLESLFRESVQPYMISWLKYNPQEEIKKLTIPILIINGTKDSQIAEENAFLLKQAYPKAQIEIIQNMNHVFKEVENETQNIEAYSNPNLPIIPSLVNTLDKFIKSI